MLSLKSERIPRATIRRLAVYVQVLESMQRNGVEVISSGPLAEACDVNASQVRKDLAYFGEFGVRGVGYNVASLIAAIKASLGVDREWRAALIGVGNLGRALLHHAEFKARGFNIVGAFDCDPFKIGEQVYGLEVTCTSDLKSAVDAKGIEIGIITTPPERAQRAADHLVEAGVCGILNFAGARIHVPEKVVVEYVDFFHYLYALAFSITGSEHRLQVVPERGKRPAPEPALILYCQPRRFRGSGVGAFVVFSSFPKVFHAPPQADDSLRRHPVSRLADAGPQKRLPPAHHSEHH